MMAAWGETSKEERGSQEEEAAVALMDGSESEPESKTLAQLKEKYAVLANLNLRNYY